MARYTNIICILLATSIFAFSAHAAALDVCKGLVLQGGSDKGAYQAGVLQGLLQKLGADGISYDVVSGLTIGAVNAAWMSQFPKGMEEPMIDEITNFWLTIKASDVYKDWFGGIVQGLLFEPSLYDTSSGSQYLKTHITQSPQRYIAIGAADANDGSFKIFSNYKDTLSVDDMLISVMASMGIGGVFPYVEIGDSTYFDGSTLKSMDVASVVNQCRNLTGGDDSKIVIDMIMLSGKSLSKAEVDSLNAIKVLIRTIELTAYNNAMIGIVRAKEAFPHVQFRYVIQPSSPLPSSDLPISFDHDEIVDMINLGQQDAAAAVALGPGVTFQQFVDEALAKKASKYGAPRSRDTLKEYLVELNEMMKAQQAEI